jgi:membrane fusion protein (multidrug efflux system)
MSMFRTRLVLGAAAVLVLAAGFAVLNTRESAAAAQSTDDAYVQADFTVVAPQVAGQLREVAVQDHQPVQAGDLLVGIDDRDLRIAADNAAARLRSGQAAIAGLEAQIARQRSVVVQARAAVASAGASLALAVSNRQRFANLARDGSGTVQAQQQAEAQWAIQQATQEREQAALRAAEQHTVVLAADLNKARAALLSAQAEQAAAALNLSRAQVLAPVAGVVTQRRARVGAYVRVGEPLLTLVPLDALYVEANFRETQLARLRAGHPVAITVDALPGLQLKGHVESLGPASGASLAAIPAHNATGNFTKIVQRLPVRIRLDAPQQGLDRLRVGMSVRPTVDVAATPLQNEAVLLGRGSVPVPR